MFAPDLSKESALAIERRRCYAREADDVEERRADEQNKEIRALSTIALDGSE